MAGLLYLLASVGNLFLANLVSFRARRARGALPIALLCVCLFLWDVSEAAKIALGNEYWFFVRLIGSSMAPAFFWHFVLAFVHKERPLRKWLALLYAATAAFSLTAAGAIFVPRLQDWVRSWPWTVANLLVLFPFLIWSFVLVRRRVHEVETPVERNAVNLVAVGIVVGTFTGLTELVNFYASADKWALGHVGSALCTLVLAVAILRHRLLEQQTPVRRVLLGFLLVVSAIFVLAALYYKAVPDKGKVWIIVGGAAIVTGLALYRLLFIRLYEQADRAKRLALIGTMAAGVAHEIKNPLAAIKGAAQFVQKELEGVEGKVEARDYLNLLVDEVDRLNGVIESFLTYARPLEPRRQDVPLQDLLADVVKLQAPSLPAAIRIETAFDRDLPPAWADPVLVRHAVTNVMRNGIEAMGQEGRLAVRTRPVVTALRSYAAVEVEDTGPGIPRDDLERIFQPFYTTKSKGTGLGLAIALRIAEAHGGEIGVENVAPHGCRFTILLPVRTL